MLIFFFFYLLLRRSISDHYLRSCGYVTCSRPQRTATGGLKPGTSQPKVLGFTTAPVHSTNSALYHVTIKLVFPPDPKKGMVKFSRKGHFQRAATCKEGTFKCMATCKEGTFKPASFIFSPVLSSFTCTFLS